MILFNLKENLKTNKWYLLSAIIVFLTVLLYGYFSYVRYVKSITVYALTSDNIDGAKQELFVQGYHVPEIQRININSVIPNIIFPDEKLLSKNYKFLGDAKNSKIWISKISPNLILKNQSGEYFEIFPIREISSYDFNINRITSINLSVDRNIPLLFVNSKHNKMILGDDSKNINFSVFNRHSPKKFIFCLCSSFLFGILAFCISKYKIPRKILMAFNKNPIVSYGLIAVLLIVYLTVFPGIYGMDTIAPNSWNGSITVWYSALYSLLCNILSIIDFNLIVPFNMTMFLCAITLLLTFTDKMSIKKQFFLLVLLTFFILCPALLVSIFGVQRLTTNNMIEILLISLLVTVAFQDSYNKLLINFTIVILFCAIAFRIENVVFVIPFIFIGKKKHLLKISVLKKGIVITAIIASVFVYLDRHCRDDMTQVYYNSISLRPMMQPYISKESPVSNWFKGQEGPLHQRDYNVALKYFALKVMENPKPYLMGCFNRFTHALFDPNTWGHSYNKFDLYKIDGSSHRKAAFSQFIIFTDICPFGKRIYDFVTHYAHLNSPFYLNGICISFLLMLFVVPLLYRISEIIQVLNISMILKVGFTFLFAPAGYALYYFDITIWIFLLLIVLFLFMNKIRDH